MFPPAENVIWVCWLLDEPFEDTLLSMVERRDYHGFG
jgi:hypothetical protein